MIMYSLLDDLQRLAKYFLLIFSEMIHLLIDCVEGNTRMVQIKVWLHLIKDKGSALHCLQH